MRRLILWLALSGAAFSAPGAAQQADTTGAVVTLDEAVRRALMVQPAMVQARGDLRNAGAGVLASTGAFLPSITASGSSTRAGGSRYNAATNQIVDQGANTAFSGTVSASLDLFDGFRRPANRRAASATQDAAEAGMVNQRFQVTLQTKQAFYDVLARDELVGVAEAQVRRTQQQLQIAVDKLRAGSATRSDTLRGAVEYGNARITLLQAQANLATAEATLGRQIGVDGAVRAVADSGLPQLPDTTAVRTTALANAPQVQQAEAEARAARAQLTVSRASYWPAFGVSVSNGFTGSEAPWSSLDTYGNNWSFRFALSWTLFNGFQREQQQVTASAQRDVAEAQAADARRQVSARLTQQLAALGTAYAQIDISRANVAAATEDLRVQQERYRVGAGTILDLLTSQENLTQAEVSLVQAQFDYLLARAELEALVGRTL